VHLDDPALPLWRRIETALAAEISAGHHHPGARLPGENALAARFGANRATLRRALAELQAKGVLRIEKGRGAFVQERSPIDYVIGRRVTFRENLLRHGIEPFAKVVRAVELPPPPDVARHLGLEPGTTVVLLETLSETDGLPLSFTRHHLPAARFPGAVTSPKAIDCISTLLRAHGVTEVTRRGVRITARLPTPDEAHHLRQASTQPILQAETVRVDGEGRAIDYTVARFAAQRAHFVLGEEASFGE
jgi:GntR family phosphonate transport system transcriptional regulator